MAKLEQGSPAWWRNPKFWQIPFVERLIYYILIPDLCARIVFETLLGYPSTGLIQPKLWIFFSLITIDYIVQLRRVLYSRFYIDKSMYAACFLLILMLHGLLLGIGWKNNPAKVVTDTIPLFVGAINILLACEPNAYKNFNTTRLETVNIIFALIMVTVSIVAIKAGRLSIISLGGAESTAVSMAIIAVSFWRRKQFGMIFVITNLAIIIVSAPFINRTTLVFIVITGFILFFQNILRSPVKIYISILLIGGAAVCAPLVIPPDSPLDRRIQGLNSENLERQQETGTGSIGDRDEEWATIQKKIHDGGQIAKVFGFGHGAIYDIVIDGVASPNYSNAHYGWALFYLRYGYFGFFYLFIFYCFVIANIFRNVRSKDNFNRFVILTCIGSVLYIFTYMAFNILLVGLQFMHKRAYPERTIAGRKVFDLATVKADQKRRPC